MNMSNLNYFIEMALQRQLNEFVGDDAFTEEHLMLIKNLSISTVTHIDGISKLKNLENLQIGCMDRLEYQIQDIIDYSELKNLPNLKSLTIVNNLHINRLDLSKLESLETLVLVADYNLNEIIGIEKLTKLKRVIIVGNNVQSLENIQQYIKNTKQTKTNILDYKIFNNICNNIDDYNFLASTSMLYDTSLVFAEKVGIGEIFIYSFNMISRINNIANNILNNIIKEDMTEEEKVSAIYHYVIENLTYNYDELSKRNNDIEKDKKQILIYDNRYKFINSSYEAFINGSVVCEGYVNMLNFLLNKIGIESRTVYCNVRRNNNSFNGVYNHAANMIKIDDEWYFFDSQLENNSNNLQYFKKTKEEFSKTHDISFSTQYISTKAKAK